LQPARKIPRACDWATDVLGIDFVAFRAGIELVEGISRGNPWRLASFVIFSGSLETSATSSEFVA